jgi:hypothetical protein
MLGLAQLVNESLTRHGVETCFDPGRLQWSDWFPVESWLSFVAVPDDAGIFALAEELAAPGEINAANGKRMLAVYRISETEYLGLTLGRLFLPGGSGAKRLSAGRCFARYAVVEDAAQRRAACSAFQQWLSSNMCGLV